MNRNPNAPHTSNEWTAITIAGTIFAAIGFFGALALEYMAGPTGWLDRIAPAITAFAIGAIGTSGYFICKRIVTGATWARSRPPRSTPDPMNQEKVP